MRLRPSPSVPPSHPPGPARTPPAPSQPPLTHHEILEIIAPFSRLGRQVDLAASERLQRRLVFKPVEHAAPAVADSPVLVETLRLENADPGHWLLTRELRHPDGLLVSLETEGGDPATLLERCEAVPPHCQFRHGDGYTLGFSRKLVPGKGGAIVAQLTRAVLQLDGLLLALRVPAVTGIPAEVELSAPQGDIAALPEDLLAVLGWDWARLVRKKDMWTSSLLLRGSGPARGADAERKLLTTAEHLARTLAEPPARFHERLARRRWGVTLRRAVPLTVCVGLIAGAAAVGQLDLPQNSVFRLVIFNAPPLLMLLYFGLREMPHIEIPPLPRALTATAWRQSAGAAPESSS